MEFETIEDLKENISALSRFPNLKYLEIVTESKFKISQIEDSLILPQNIKDIEKLQYLQVTGTFKIDYNRFFETLQLIPNLEYLGLGQILNELQIPDGFLSLKELKGVKLSGNNEFRFPSDMSGMTRLESIIMAPAEHSNLSDELNKFATIPNLKHLYLRFAELNHKTFKDFNRLKDLTTLNFSNPVISDFRELIENLPGNLEVLKFFGLDVKSNGADFKHFNKLEKLIIFVNPRVPFKLDSSIFSLGALNYLKINMDRIGDVSEKIGNLENLIFLDLSGNNITSLPESIRNLDKLRILKIGNNKIKVLPREIGELENLEILDLSYNELSSLPESIGGLENLTNLNIEYNRVRVLPPGFTKLINLRELKLGMNHLVKLPKEIGDLKNLVVLDLRGNFLKQLPDSFTGLKNLEYLRLSYNDLGSLLKLSGI